MTPSPLDLSGPTPAIAKHATMSTCGLYRTRLTRRWAPGPLLPFCMLNPSTADAELDDPTIRRTMSFAKREGCGGVDVGNLYAFRATSPADMQHALDPFGPENAAALARIAADAARHGIPIVCAWGVHGSGLAVVRAMRIFRQAGADTVCLGLTASGAPRHPLYVKGDQPLVPYPAASAPGSVEHGG